MPLDMITLGIVILLRVAKILLLSKNNPGPNVMHGILKLEN